MRSFENIVKDLAVDECLGRSAVDAAKSVVADYLIIFNGRSGSSWLTSLLAGRLGNPDEHINPEFLRQSATTVGAVEAKTFMQALRGVAQIDGVFGIEATSEHIAIFGEDVFFKAFPKLTVFHLWRENLVAQAVSLFRATATGYFHSVEGDNPVDPEYNAAKLSEWFRYLAHVENLNVELVERRSLQPINLTYETLFMDKQKTLAVFYRALGMPVPDTDLPVDEKIRKIGGNWSKDTEAKFRQDHAELIASVEAVRKTRLLAMKSCLDNP
ncbi:hypothetical protein JJB09_23460 [Rhizobium sp. KVB221]|uniref:Sulphotransferase Stf0 domain-containing protein n=1 Tax=Rhizobium setariae TaxID=2801340 RepID=A0A937CPJ1_9HYPH|nr:Stf0 family sulfotransferase [Rhizobium setariae]MBL0374976.1 hypothetical protein [Rhizobium setariae]